MIPADTSPLPPLPARDPRGHKGSFGTVAVVGGCAQAATPMIGAPALSARAAFRTGSGLVRLVMPAPVLVAGLSLIPSATGIAIATDEDGFPITDPPLLALVQQADALVVGPGLGPERPRSRPVAELVRSCVGLGLPTVLDADGLNALVAGEQLHRVDLSRCVLTPHPGEFARLAAVRGITTSATDPATRPDAASALARSLGCVVVLKGAGTVVSDGSKAWVCRRGHPCLGTAGTGDVLAGLTGSLLAQLHAGGLSLYNLARIAVETHAVSGERWAHEHKAHAGLLAQELADMLPGVLAEFTDAGESPSPRA